MTTPSLPGWLFPPEQGFFAQDLDHIPDLPPHTELIDGSLVFVSPQASFHTLTLFLLERELRASVPAALKVRREMSVVLGPRQRPEPDLVVFHARAVTGKTQTAFQAEDVVLAVEVVSPDSEVRDRERKPQIYARAGIQHFWRVENVSGYPTVYVYELDPATQAYVPTGIYHAKLQLLVPFSIDIDLTEIDAF
ncbi:Endonuclease, Uma2 family (restriction endonuclease fold) [Sinosporangium album]|uniref:Endonuclease, Uma2 family (Restriction endonuclease fold) n=2 Tax=Sinosporangium album TaxID=504805 RepID=A0A1G7TFD8_9ACTN|nr:Endonuclease, Uma2 family (restriction endonuclease fold) [Sinosporangium album]